MIEYEFHADESYAVVIVSGENTLQEFKDATVNFRTDPQFHKSLDRICDFTFANLSALGTLDLVRYVSFSRSIPASKNSRLALVGPADNSFLLMFVNAFTSFEIKVFLDRESAVSWLTTNAANHTRVIDMVVQSKLKVHDITGELTMIRAERLQTAWVESKEYDPAMPVVWDIRGAVLTTTLPILETTAIRMFAEREKSQHSSRVAIVFDKIEHELMLRHAFKKPVGAGRTKLFGDAAAAISWATG